MGLGEYRHAIALCERSMSLLEGKPVGERFGMASVASVVTRIPLVLSLAELGDVANGIAQGEEVVRIAEMVGQPFSLVGAYLMLSHIYIVKGDLEKAAPLAEGSLDICRNAEIVSEVSRAVAQLGYALSPFRPRCRRANAVETGGGATNNEKVLYATRLLAG